MRLNEYRVWQREDPHATRAYEVLKTPRSKQIVERLGWGPSATDEPRCLSCHSTVVAKSMQGNGFKPQDEVRNGITCEACHGGSERWINGHMERYTSHAVNLQAGMFPTDQVDQRAELCLSCHLGDAKNARFVTHRMMAAGHPRMTFELATFTLAQPAHFVVDSDYQRVRGKSVSSAATTWMVGQLTAARLWLSLIGNSTLNHEESWPEFTFYKCESCHQPIDSAGVSGAPGTIGFPRPACDSLLMATLILTTIAPHAAVELGEVVGEIARLSPARDLSAPAAKGARLLADVLPEIGQPDSKDTPSLRKILAAIAASTTGELTYAAATQRYMAAQSLVATIEHMDRLQGDAVSDIEHRATLAVRLAPLFNTLQDNTKYNPDKFRLEMARLVASTH